MDKRLGYMPLAPRKFVRDIELHGHHRKCPVHGETEDVLHLSCVCVELDRDDYESECERRLDSWRNGDYMDRGHGGGEAMSVSHCPGCSGSVVRVVGHMGDSDSYVETTCPGCPACAEKDNRIAELEEELAQAQRALGAAH